MFDCFCRLLDRLCPSVIRLCFCFCPLLGWMGIQDQLAIFGRTFLRFTQSFQVILGWASILIQAGDLWSGLFLGSYSPSRFIYWQNSYLWPITLRRSDGLCGATGFDPGTFPIIHVVIIYEVYRCHVGSSSIYFCTSTEGSQDQVGRQCYKRTFPWLQRSSCSWMCQRPFNRWIIGLSSSAIILIV